VIKEIDESLAIANAEPEIEAILSEELNDIFKPFNPEVISPRGYKKIRFIDAISSSLKQSMERHNNLVIMGQDVAEYGGALKLLMDLSRNLAKNE
jgi:2-oxoisovalerate dehydrogenase E1 component